MQDVIKAIDDILFRPVSYCFLVGLVFSFIAGDREKRNWFHKYRLPVCVFFALYIGSRFIFAHVASRYFILLLPIAIIVMTMAAAELQKKPENPTGFRTRSTPASPGSTPRASASRPTAARSTMRTASITGTAKTRNTPTVITGSGHGASASIAQRI